MNTLTHDFESMTQHVAAIPVLNSSYFVTVRDERRLPVFVGLGNDGTFYAFKENDSGARVMIDLSAAFGVSGTEIVAFDLMQDADELLYIYFSSQSGDSNPPDGLTAFRPNDLDVNAGIPRVDSSQDPRIRLRQDQSGQDLHGKSPRARRGHAN
jgi:hypothetical protein